MQPVEKITSNTNSSETSGTLSAVILAGSLRHSPLREAMNVHALCLPIGRSGTLLDRWLALMESVPALQHVRIVVSAEEDAISVRSALPKHYRSDGAGRLVVEVMAEKKAWRGAGGVVRDVTEGQPDDALILVCEGSRLPPPSLDPLLRAVADPGWGPQSPTAASGGPSPSADQVEDPQRRGGWGPLAGAVGVCGDDMPAGVYAFRRRAINLVPRIGYSDMKEQVLPALCNAGQRIVVARLSDDLWPVSDLEAYLSAVRHSLTNEISDPQSTAWSQESGVGSQTDDRSQESGVRNQTDGGPRLTPDSGLLTSVSPAALRVSSRASVSGSAMLDGFCIIEPGAVIEDGAVVHDSVVLWGATIGGGAVVSRSVVAPLANVEPRMRAVRSVVTRNRH